jgi:pterin-4a-carbinolamine dehydratase
MMSPTLPTHGENGLTPRDIELARHRDRFAAGPTEI